jgi:polyisoprenoid-binding protein YceI
MVRASVLSGLLLVAWLAGCATRLDRPEPPRPGPHAGAGPSHGEPARSVGLSGDNTRVTFIGSAEPTSHEGSFSRLSGRIDLPTEDPKDARLAVEVEMDSVYTKIGLLTMHLKRPDMFDVAHYPTASFVSRRVEPGASADGGRLVTGDFTLHGVTRTLTFPARFAVTPDEVSLEATFPIRQTAFGMTDSAEKTKDEVPITVSIHARRRS